MAVFQVVVEEGAVEAVEVPANLRYNNSMKILEEKTFTILRLSLAITFLWFGVLKFFNVSPVLPMIKIAMTPFITPTPLFLITLSLLEIVIGLALLLNKFVKSIVVIMILHLIVATLSVLITQGFEPRFPVLSLAGEFVTKNVVLMAAGLVLFFHNNPSNSGSGTGLSDNPSEETVVKR